MQPPAKVFLDTAALRYASERVIRSYKIPKVIRWGRGAEAVIPMLRCYEDYPNEKLGWRRRHQWAQAVTLSFIAWLAKQGRIELLCTEAVRIELSGLPRRNDPRGLFYDSPITWVKPPAWRVSALHWLVGPFILDEEGRVVRPMNARERQLDFLGSIQCKRFIELQKATGAYQGHGRRPPENQLLDAFHLWCAESAGADYFLTLDEKLLRHLGAHRSYPPKVACAAPIQLTKALDQRGTYSWRDYLPYISERIRQLWHPQTNHPLESMVTLTRHLDRLERPSLWKRWFGAA